MSKDKTEILEEKESPSSHYSSKEVAAHTALGVFGNNGLEIILNVSIDPANAIGAALGSVAMDQLVYTKGGQLLIREHMHLTSALPYDPVSRSQYDKAMNETKQFGDAGQLVNDWMNGLIQIADPEIKKELLKAKEMFEGIKARGEKENKELAKAIKRVQRFQKIIDSPTSGLARGLVGTAAKTSILHVIPALSVAGGAIAVTAATAAVSMGISIGIMLTIALALTLTKVGLDYKKDKAESKNLEDFHKLNLEFNKINIRFIELMEDLAPSNTLYQHYLKQAGQYLEYSLKLAMTPAEHQDAALAANLSLESTFDIIEEAVGLDKLLKASPEKIFERLVQVKQSLRVLEDALKTNRKNMGILQMTAIRTTHTEATKNLHVDIAFYKDANTLLEQRMKILKTEMDIHMSTLQNVHGIKEPSSDRRFEGGAEPLSPDFNVSFQVLRSVDQSINEQQKYPKLKGKLSSDLSKIESISPSDEKLFFTRSPDNSPLSESSFRNQPLPVSESQSMDTKRETPKLSKDEKQLVVLQQRVALLQNDMEIFLENTNRFSQLFEARFPQVKEMKPTLGEWHDLLEKFNHTKINAAIKLIDKISTKQSEARGAGSKALGNACEKLESTCTQMIEKFLEAHKHYREANNRCRKIYLGHDKSSILASNQRLFKMPSHNTTTTQTPTQLDNKGFAREAVTVS